MTPYNEEQQIDNSSIADQWSGNISDDEKLTLNFQIKRNLYSIFVETLRIDALWRLAKQKNRFEFLNRNLALPVANTRSDTLGIVESKNCVC